jgi:hypothetical protein
MSGFVTLLVIVCIHADKPDSCVSERVVDSTQAEMTMAGCMGLEGLVSARQFVAGHPLYKNWTLKGWRCQIGNRKAPDKGRA